MEKRHQREIQQEEDYKLALKLQDVEVSPGSAKSSGNASSLSASRVAMIGADDSLMFAGSNSAPSTSTSRYAASPNETASTSVYSQYGNRNGNTSVQTSNTGESFDARSKYSKAKGISSDQYFGVDDQYANDMKGKLSKYSGSNAISSDMLYHDAEAFKEPADGFDITVDTLKDSVKDFFSGLQRNI